MLCPARSPRFHPITCAKDSECPYGLCNIAPNNVTGQCRIGPRWDLISEGDDYDPLNAEGRLTAAGVTRALARPRETMRALTGVRRALRALEAV